MDTRQLAAFCAVVERKSFSQAAERLGVTQPAVSLQVRALEKRLGTQLLDRSGRRVEPTEAGRRLYRGAQRLLALEEQIVGDVTSGAEGELSGELSIGASTGPAAIVVPRRLCEFQPATEPFASRSRCTTRRRSSTSSPSASSSSASSARPAATAACASSRSSRRGDPRLPARSRVCGSHDVARGAARRAVDRDAGGRRRPPGRRGRAARPGVRLRDLDVPARARAAGVGASAVSAGYGVTFISRTAVETELATGALAEARVEGMDARARSRSSAAPAARARA